MYVFASRIFSPIFTVKLNYRKEFPISNCEHVCNKNNISYLNRRTRTLLPTCSNLQEHSSFLSFLCMSFLCKAFIVVILRNGKGNCHKLNKIKRKSNLPHSSLYYPLTRELKWGKNSLIYSFKSKTKMMFYKSTMCQIPVIT